MGSGRVKKQISDQWLPQSQPHQVIKPVKRSDSLTKQEKTKLNLLKSRGRENSVASLRERFEQQAMSRDQVTVTQKFNKVESNKINRKLNGSNKKRIKRRHTVGGTKDLSSNPPLKENQSWDRLAPLKNREELSHGHGSINLEVRRSSFPDEEPNTWRHSLP